MTALGLRRRVNIGIKRVTERLCDHAQATEFTVTYYGGSTRKFRLGFAEEKEMGLLPSERMQWVLDFARAQDLADDRKNRTMRVETEIDEWGETVQIIKRKPILKFEKKEPEHSRFGGSTADRFVNCPASVGKSADMPPDEDTVFTIEGTTLHGVAETCLRLFVTSEYQTRKFDYLFSTLSLSPEQMSCVLQYVEYVIASYDKAKAAHKDVTLYVESRVRLLGHPEFYGTADAALVITLQGKRGDVLVDIIDFKAGRGVEVEIQYDGIMNRQLGYYALGVHDMLLSSAQKKVFKGGTCTIVQPRFSDSVKTKSYEALDLHDLRRELVLAAEEADSDDPGCRAGKWCRFCRAKPVCDVHRQDVMDKAKLDFVKEGGMPDELTPMQMNNLLNDAAMMESWVASVKSYAKHYIEKLDGDIPEWKTAPKRAVRKWTEEQAVRDMVKPHLSLHDDAWSKMFPETPLSPHQMSIFIQNHPYLRDKGLLEDLEPLIVAESSGTKLVKKGEEHEPD